MLRHTIGLVGAAVLLPLLAVMPQAAASDGETQCPPGTDPVSVGSGVICVVVTDARQPRGAL